VPPGAITVPTPDDIVVLRRTDPAEATSWRLRLREELGTHLATGGRIVGFTRSGEYVVLPGRSDTLDA
jgi:predicted GNAT superfamily acetyltransferase